MKILILGHNGMLGHMVKKYMEFFGFKIETLNEKWPNVEFLNRIKNSNSDFLINCIGCIPQKKPNWELYKSVNIKLPIFLSENFNGKIIHPTTDCEFSGNLPVGFFYLKDDIKDAIDDYGISKSHASHILSSKNNVKQIRTSIIGPELNSKVSLMEWFFKQTEPINGFETHYWNGITTLEWSKQCLNIIKNWDVSHNIVQLGTSYINKYELLCLINKIYNLNKNINRLKTDVVNKCLKSDYEIISLEKQLIELKTYE